MSSSSITLIMDNARYQRCEQQGQGAGAFHGLESHGLGNNETSQERASAQHES
jgi:hypothetical protein